MKHKCHNSFLFGTDPPYPASASLLPLITPTFPPTQILAATNDDAIPVEQSYMLYEKCKEMGVDVVLGRAEGAMHGFVEMPMGKRWWEGVILPGLEWARGKALA